MNIKIDKNNICEALEGILKKMNIRYNVSDNNSKGALYNIFIASLDGNIQIEYNEEDDSDDYIVLHFFTEIDDNGIALYENIIEGDITVYDIEVELEEFSSAIKNINKGINKIKQKIEKITEICEEYNLNIEDFITIKYIFD